MAPLPPKVIAQGQQTRHLPSLTRMEKRLPSPKRSTTRCGGVGGACIGGLAVANSPPTELRRPLRGAKGRKDFAADGLRLLVLLWEIREWVRSRTGVFVVRPFVGAKKMLSFFSPLGCRRQRRKKGSPTWRVFSLKELYSATNNFNYDNKLGEGGFGSVYCGHLRDGSQVLCRTGIHVLPSCCLGF